MNVFDAGLQVKGAQLDFLLELGKSDHEFLLRRHPFQTFYILQLDRRIGSKSHLDHRPWFDSHDIYRSLGVAGITKSRDRGKTSLLQPAEKNTPDCFLDHKITEVSVGDLTAENAKNAESQLYQNLKTLSSHGLTHFDVSAISAGSAVKRFTTESAVHTEMKRAEKLPDSVLRFL
jgi:hypothetical protein